MAAHVDDSKIQMKYGEYRFNPAPLMTYSQESVTNDAGERISDSVTLSFRGVLLNLDDMASGDLAQMITRRDEMINALSGNSNEFQVLHNIGSTQVQGSPIISGIYPRVDSLTFDEGVWTSQIPYSFDLVYETNARSGQVPVQSFSDNWDFEEDEGKRIIRATHTVSAQGINTSTSGDASDAMTNAKTWVVARMGVSTIPSTLPAFADSGTLNTINKLQKYRTEAASEVDGTFEASEEITLSSGLYAHSYTEQLQTNDQGITTVTLNGDINGMGRFATATTNALSGWTDDIKPTLSGLAYSAYTDLELSGTLNLSNQQSLSTTRDDFNGRVAYSVTYTDDPKEDVPSGISEINISKQTKLPIRKVALFEIPNRAAGSILHNIGTPTDGQININGTVKGLTTTQMSYVKTVSEDQVNALRPNSALYNQLWFTDYNTTENEDQMTFSFSIVWGYTDNLANVPSPSGEVSF